MEKINYSKYNLIKAVLASNLEEDMKENIVNSLINCYQPQPIYYGLTTTTSDAIRNPNITYTGDLKC